MRFLSLFAVGLLALTASADDKTFRGVREAVKPGDDEDRWASIPWHTNLWEARTLAAKQGKPLLLWEMDGHPLGCT